MTKYEITYRDSRNRIVERETFEAFAASDAIWHAHGVARVLGWTAEIHEA